MRVLGLLCVMMLATTASTAFGGFAFQFDQPNYSNLNPGQTVTTGVYVTATAPDVLNVLSGANFVLTGTGGNTTMTTFTSSNLFGTNPGSPAGNVLNHAATSGFAAPVANRVRIGDLSFLAGSLGSVTTFSFSDPNSTPGVDNMFATINGTGAAQSIDSLVFAGPSSVTFSVTAVPEPSSIALLAVSGIGAIAVRRYRNRKALAC
jgi:PEP-CTERM motif